MLLSSMAGGMYGPNKWRPTVKFHSRESRD